MELIPFEIQMKFLKLFLEPIGAKAPTTLADSKFLRIERRIGQPMTLFCAAMSYPVPVFKCVNSNCFDKIFATRGGRVGKPHFIDLRPGCLAKSSVFDNENIRDTGINVIYNALSIP